MNCHLKANQQLEIACLFLMVIFNVNCITINGGETRWQLFNQCSKAMLQTFLGRVNTRGNSSHLCLTDFNVKVNRWGQFQLQHAQSRKYICFSRRKRVTVRTMYEMSAHNIHINGVAFSLSCVGIYVVTQVEVLNAASMSFIQGLSTENSAGGVATMIDGNNLRCFFIERINELGYTEIESAWEPGQFLGFNSRGRFQDPSTYWYKPKCFSWTKLQRFVPNSEIHRCYRAPKKEADHRSPIHHEHTLRNLMRASLLQKIRATDNGPYKLQNVTSS